MFTLQELRLIKSLTDRRDVGVPFDLAHVAASVAQKLIDNIADLEQREERAKAATKLRAVKNESEPASSIGSGE